MSKKGVFALFAGLVAGAATGVLFSPTSGKKFRDKLKKEIDKGGYGKDSLYTHFKGIAEDIKNTTEEGIELAQKNPKVAKAVKKAVATKKKVSAKAKAVAKKVVSKVDKLEDQVSATVKKTKKTASKKVNAAKSTAKKVVKKAAATKKKVTTKLKSVKPKKS